MSESEDLLSARAHAGAPHADLLVAERVHELRDARYEALRSLADAPTEIEQVWDLDGALLLRRTSVRRVAGAPDEALRVHVAVIRKGPFRQQRPLAEALLVASPGGDLGGDRPRTLVD